MLRVKGGTCYNVKGHVSRRAMSGHSVAQTIVKIVAQLVYGLWIDNLRAIKLLITRQQACNTTKPAAQVVFMVFPSK